MFETFFVCILQMSRVEVVWLTKVGIKDMLSLNVPLDTFVTSSILKKVNKVDAKIIYIFIAPNILNMMHVILTCMFIV
jgi:hypothetical protein